MKGYPVSDKLRNAIETIYTEPEGAYQILGAKRALDDSYYQTSIDANTAIQERAALFREEVEEYIILLAKQYLEFDEEYQELLNSFDDEDGLNFNVREKIEFETSKLLMVLRWFKEYLPESFNKK